MTVIYPPTLDFHRLRQRPQHLMQQFAAAGYPVFFCNQTQQPDRPPEPVGENLWVVHDHRWFVRSVVPALGRTLVWCSWPRLHVELDVYRPAWVIYDCVDDFAEWRPHTAAMAARADAVIVTARALEERWRGRHPHVLRVPNGCDYDFFSRPPGRIPADVPRDGRARAGFVGAWGRWVDDELVTAVAARLPGWRVVIIGPDFGGRRPRGRNIVWLGERPYADLPAYLHALDVALIPFRDDAVTRAAHPIKLWEYLAAGCPVVSTPLPEVLPYAGTAASAVGGSVRVADRAGFAAAILAARGDPHRAERMALARANSWRERFTDIAALLRTLGVPEPGGGDQSD